MKKIALVIFMAFMVMALTACGGEEAKGKDHEEKQEEVEVTAEEEKEKEEAEEIKPIPKDFVFNDRGEDKEVSLEEVQVHDELQAQIFLPKGFELTVDKQGRILSHGTEEFGDIEVSVFAGDQDPDSPMKDFENFKIGLESMVGASDDTEVNEIELNKHDLDRQYDYLMTAQSNFLLEEDEQFEQKVYGGVQIVEGKVYEVEVWINDKALFDNDELAYGIMKNIVPEQ